jgi:uncharacterized protein
MSGEVIGIFVKAPVPGKCKTRLCPPLSEHEATSLYRAFCEDVLAMAQKTAKDVRIVYDSSPDYPTPHWTTPHYLFILQNGNDLGERLQNAFNQLFSAGYLRVVIIGSDTPTLSPDIIKEAFELLNLNEAVFGPAADGGYYLVGLSKPNPHLFQNIPWSTGQVMAVTQRRLGELKIPADYLPVQSDVDTEEDLVHLMDELKSSPLTLAPATRFTLSKLESLKR